MIKYLFTKKHKKVTRAVVEQYFRTFEPELVQARLGRKLRRRLFWAAGVNVLWCIDQHDKWKYKFGLCLHVGVDAFSGYVLWLRIWWNNSNPIAIANYYLETVESLGYVPLLTQSDPGTENTRTANAQSFLRQRRDPNLRDGAQHNWKRDKSNIKAEIQWSQLRRRWSPGFESMLEEGVRNGWYDMGNPIQVLLFRWVFVPWLQAELDEYREMVNNFPKRADKHKLTPGGRPVDIHFRPRESDSRDFKVTVSPEDVAAARSTYIPDNHPVLRLVPSAFDKRANAAYNDIGRPAITFDTAWDIYREVLEHIEVAIVVGLIPFDEVKGWADNVVHESTADDRAIVEAEEVAGGLDLFNPDQPAPEGFVVVEDGVQVADWTDDEDEGGDGDAWLPDE